MTEHGKGAESRTRKDRGAWLPACIAPRPTVHLEKGGSS